MFVARYFDVVFWSHKTEMGVFTDLLTTRGRL